MSTAGNDANSGAAGAPYRSIAKAAAVAEAGDVVNIRAGTYEEMLRPASSGTAGAPIVFQGYGDERVVITAMQTVNGWTRDAGSVFKAQVSWDMGQQNFVMYQSTAMDLARWPNNTDGKPFTQNTLRNTGGSGANVENNAYLDYSPGLPDLNWADGGTVYFYGDKPGSGWIAWKANITSASGTRVGFDLVKNPSWIRTFHAPADYGDFFLEGVRGALDYENEWYFNPDTNTLYVQIPGGEAPASDSIKMRRRELTVDLHNRSHIHVRNLAVFGGSINMTGNASNNRLSGVSSFYGNHIRGVFSGFLSGAQSVRMQGSDNIIEHSEIAFGSGSGIRDEGQRNQILNSYVHDFNFLGSYDAILMLRGGSDSIVRNNVIARGGRDAVQGFNQNTEFSYNDVSFSNLIVDDCALFYTVGGPRNIHIHHNWFHDAYSSGTKTKAAGIYLDNDAAGFKVHHNVVWNTEWSSIQINWNGTDIDIFNNTLVDGSQVMGAWHKAGTQFSDVRVWNNLSNDDSWEPQSDKQNNVTYTQDPFVSKASGNFALKANSQAIDRGRVIAGITDNATGAAPDVGAYEFGATNWVAGTDWDLDAGAADRCYQLPGEPCASGGGEPPPSGPYTAIPGRLEAEAFSAQSGVRTQSTQDVGGGLNVGYIENGDYIEFDIDVADAASYEVDLRVASSTSGGRLALQLGNGDTVGEAIVENTGGWQSWQTEQIEATLPQGRQKLRVSFTSLGAGGSGYLMNLNWLEFKTSGNPPTDPPPPADIDVTDAVPVILDLLLDDESDRR